MNLSSRYLTHSLAVLCVLILVWRPEVFAHLSYNWPLYGFSQPSGELDTYAHISGKRYQYQAQTTCWY